jgi:hypothetical protein
VGTVVHEGTRFGAIDLSPWIRAFILSRFYGSGYRQDQSMHIMARMNAPRFQLSIGGMLGVVACIAINVWLFKLHVLWGIVGLNVTKHVVIAYLCQVVGVDRRARPDPRHQSGPAAPLVARIEHA